MTKVFIFFLLLITFLQDNLSEAASYTYIGCFADNSASHDLTGPSVSLNDPNVTVDSCFSDCQRRGYAYVGLQGGNKMCYCGSSYGYYGASTTECGMKCGDKECGNLNSNSVYYSVDMNSTVSSTRQVMFVSLTQPYSAARMDCVAHNGDLVTFNKAQANQTAEVVRSQTGKLTKVWVGLRKNDSSGNYEWVNPAVPAYDINSADSVDWKQEQISSSCVLFDVISLKYETAPCNVPFAYLCLSVPWSDPEPYTPSTPTTGNSKLVLYIILPIFILCYGGSCVIYSIHKILKHCRARKNPKAQFLGRVNAPPPMAVLFPPPLKKSAEMDQDRFKGGHPTYIATNFDLEKITKVPPTAASMKTEEVVKGELAGAQRRFLGNQVKESSA